MLEEESGDWAATVADVASRRGTTGVGDGSRRRGGRGARLNARDRVCLSRPHCWIVSRGDRAATRARPAHVIGIELDDHRTAPIVRGTGLQAIGDPPDRLTERALGCGVVQRASSVGQQEMRAGHATRVELDWLLELLSQAEQGLLPRHHDLADHRHRGANQSRTRCLRPCDDLSQRSGKPTTRTRICELAGAKGALPRGIAEATVGQLAVQLPAAKPHAESEAERRSLARHACVTCYAARCRRRRGLHSRIQVRSPSTMDRAASRAHDDRVGEYNDFVTTESATGGAVVLGPVS